MKQDSDRSLEAARLADRAGGTECVQVRIGDGGRLEDYRDYLRVLARIRLGHGLQGKLDASDIAQQTILQAHAARDQFHGTVEDEKLAWLRAILVNVIAGAGRRFESQARDVRRERSLGGEGSSRFCVEVALVADQSSPSQRLMRCEELRQLSAGLARLPDDQRRVVEAHHLEGLTVAEIAARMERSGPAVVGLLFRGLQRLRQLLVASGEIFP